MNREERLPIAAHADANHPLPIHQGSDRLAGNHLHPATNDLVLQQGMQTLPLEGHAGNGQPHRTAAWRGHLEGGEAAAGAADLVADPKIIESPQGIGQQTIATGLGLRPACPLEQQNSATLAAQVNSCGTPGRPAPNHYDISMHVQTVPVDNFGSNLHILHILPVAFQARRGRSWQLSKGLENSYKSSIVQVRVKTGRRCLCKY
jgi:hypothetical protein